jgi:hypothetical protein
MFLLAIVAGCARPTFTNLGNGVAVPVESIKNYATEHGVSHAAAAAQLRIESDDRRIKEHAAKFGITVEEAERQIEHAAPQEPGS